MKQAQSKEEPKEGPKEETQELPIPEGAIFYEGKILVPENSSLISSYRAVATIPNKKPTFTWVGARMPWELWKQVVTFLKYTQDAHDDESLILFFYHRKKKEWRCWAPPQTSGGMTVEQNEDTPEYKEQRKELAGFTCIGTIHHHCKSAAFQSSTDSHDELQRPGYHITLGKMDQETGQFDYHGRITHEGTQHPLDLAEFVEMPEEFRNECPSKKLLSLFGGQTAISKAWNQILLGVVNFSPGLFKGKYDIKSDKEFPGIWYTNFTPSPAYGGNFALHYEHGSFYGGNRTYYPNHQTKALGNGTKNKKTAKAPPPYIPPTYYSIEQTLKKIPNLEKRTKQITEKLNKYELAFRSITKHAIDYGDALVLMSFGKATLQGMGAALSREMKTEGLSLYLVSDDSPEYDEVPTTMVPETLLMLQGLVVEFLAKHKIKKEEFVGTFHSIFKEEDYETLFSLFYNQLCSDQYYKNNVLLASSVKQVHMRVPDFFEKATLIEA
jgi:proteasome lid subunit RPN8/RPN11